MVCCYLLQSHDKKHQSNVSQQFIHRISLRTILLCHFNPTALLHFTFILHMYFFLKHINLHTLQYTYIFNLLLFYCITCLHPLLTCPWPAFIKHIYLLHGFPNGVGSSKVFRGFIIIIFIIITQAIGLRKEENTWQGVKNEQFVGLVFIFIYQVKSECIVMLVAM